MNPLHFQAAAGMGLCCAAVGDAEGALAAYQQAVALNPRLAHLRHAIRQLSQQLAEKRGQGEQPGRPRTGE